MTRATARQPKRRDLGDFAGRMSSPLIYRGMREVDTMWNAARQ